MKSETDLGRNVIGWLTAQHWEIYQEVKITDSVADIVAVQGQLVWIIECKMTMSLDLIAQAMNWIKRAHFVSVAVPLPRNKYGKAREMARLILRQYGIGLLEVRENGNVNRGYLTDPRLNRKARVESVKKRLCEKQKTWADAGSQNGYWTPFQETGRRILSVVKQNPGISLKDLIEKTEHHYNSDLVARACIGKWAQKGIIKGIRCEKNGRFIRFYPLEN